MTSLADSPIGRTVLVRGHDHRFGQDYEVEAYLPDPLPTSVDLDGSAWTAIAGAMRELGALDAAARHVPNPRLVIRFATRVEAIGTSALEGTYANLPELFAAEVVPENSEQSTSVPDRVREVLNYIRTADSAYAAVPDADLTQSLLSALQAQLVKGTESDGPQAGAVRTTQVFIGPKHRPITEARFVPSPPGDQLQAMFDQWFAWIRLGSDQTDLPILARVAMAHYQFETIHPYHDGNGRLGRLAAVLQLMKAGELNAPVLSVSPWLKDREDQYKEHLMGLSVTGNWSPWIAFFAEAVEAEAMKAQGRIERLLDLRDRLASTARERLPRARLAIDIADNLIEFPILSVSMAEAHHGKTNQAARNAIKRLTEIGLLEPYGERRYGQLYWSPEVFQAVDD